MTKNWIVKNKNALTATNTYKAFEKYEDAEAFAKRQAADKADCDIGIYELVAAARSPVPNIEIVKIV